MDAIKKKTLRAALAAVRKQYHDSIAECIINEPTKTYLQIAREHGVSEQWVFDVAKMRGLGRNALPAEEAIHG